MIEEPVDGFLGQREVVQGIVNRNKELGNMEVRQLSLFCKKCCF
jgi:hypothetical protein